MIPSRVKIETIFPKGIQYSERFCDTSWSSLIMTRRLGGGGEPYLFYLVQLKNVNVYIGESPDCLSTPHLPLQPYPRACHLESQIYEHVTHLPLPLVDGHSILPKARSSFCLISATHIKSVKSTLSPLSLALICIPFLFLYYYPGLDNCSL